MIYLENQQTKFTITEQMEELIHRIVEETLRQEDVQDEVEMSVVLVDEEQIQQLNLEYRGFNKPTDVLSFAQEDGEEMFPEIDEIPFRLLGDIVIAVDIANEQANRYQHSLEREMAFLTAHGVLHLLGYDHGDEEDDEELASMLEIQEIVLNKLGLLRQATS